MAINNLRTQYYTENDGAGGAAQQAASIGLSLPADWATYSPQAKINWFNANGVTPDQLLQAGVSQGDIDWMSQNGYAGGATTNALAPAPAPALAQTSVLPANFDLAKGSQIINGVTYSPQFENQTQGEGGLMEGGTLAAIQRHVPGQNTFDTLDPVTGQVIGTYEGEKDRGFLGGLVSHAGSIGKDVAPLALAALGVNALGAGLGQPSIFGPGAAAATGGAPGTLSGATGLTPAQLEAAIGTPGYGALAPQTLAASTVPGLLPSAGFVGMTPADIFGPSVGGTPLIGGTPPIGGGPSSLSTAPTTTVLGTPAAELAATPITPPVTPTITPPVIPPVVPGGTPAVATTPSTPPGVTPPGGATTDPFAYLLPAIGSLIGGYTQGQSAKEAAEATAAASTRAAELQRDAQREALALQARMYDEAVARQQPYYQAGTNALAQMQQRTNAMPEAFQYGGEIPQFAYSGQQPAAFQYTGQQPTFEYGGQQPEAFKFTAENFQADPGYGFRLSEGLKALERSAAARGGLLSGGTGKALTRFGQDMASQEFQNAYGRAFNEYGAARQREQEQYGRALTGFDIARQREAQEYGRGLTGYDIGRQREQEQYGRALTGYNALRSRESDMYGRALTGYNALRQREADQYNRLAGLAGIGGTTAQQLTAAGQNYGSQAGNLMANTATNLSNLAMQQGQTAGNALLAQGAAYGRAFGDLGYLGGQYLGYPRP
jgi:hypothetical protein